MRKLLIAGGLMMAVALCLGPIVKAGIVFEDDFSVPGLADYDVYTQMSGFFGTWVVEDGVLKGQNRGWEAVFVKDLTVTDFTAEVDARYVGPFPPGPDNHMGIMFRFQFVGGFGSYIGELYDTAQQAKIDWWWGGVIQAAPQPIVADQWYHLKVVAKGTSLKLYVDGELKVDVTDSRLASGRIGLGFSDVHGDQHAEFDNLVISTPPTVEELAAVLDINGDGVVDAADIALLAGAKGDKGDIGLTGPQGPPGLLDQETLDDILNQIANRVTKQVYNAHVHDKGSSGRNTSVPSPLAP